MEKKLDGNYTRMLRAILNKSLKQHPTKHQLYGHLPPITKMIKARRTRHAGHCWRSRDELISDVLVWTPHMAEQKQDEQLETTYSSSVRIRDLALRTCLGWWMIGRRVRDIRAGSFSLEFEWQQVFSSLQDSSQIFTRPLHSSFGDCTKSTNYNW